MSLLSSLLQRLKRFFFKSPRRAKRYRIEGLKYANEIIDAIERLPNRGHFVGASTLRDCETFAKLLASRNIQGVRIATLDPRGKDQKVSYVVGINLMNSRVINVLIGTTSVFSTGWGSDGAINSIHCLHDLLDSKTETQYLARMRNKHGVVSSATNFINGQFR